MTADLAAMNLPKLTAKQSNGRTVLSAGGSWTLKNLDQLESVIASATTSQMARQAVAIDAGEISDLDTAGALVLRRLSRDNSNSGFVNLPARFTGLLQQMERVSDSPPAAPRAKTLTGWLEHIGRLIADLGRDLLAIATLLGAFCMVLGRTIAHPSRFRLTSTVHHLDRVALQAIPIILLITFLIGGIIAQQGIFHFRKFGAETYVVDMVGILVLREIGVLIVAIMVAGRSGSSYTAELGSMKMREEIDAVRTMGLDPVELLIVPRVIALIIGLPLLTFLGSMSALYGGELACWLYGGMAPEIYLSRLKDAISITHFNVGMIKAPFMALVIGIVACAQGLSVTGSAESLGLQTTSSVVKSIFLVIVLDGLFAVFFASIDM